MKLVPLIALLVLIVSIVPIWVSFRFQKDAAFEPLKSAVFQPPISIQSLASLPNPSGRCPQRTFQWDSKQRSDRFPSVDERVCMYMTRWYDPHYRTNQQWNPQLSHRQVDALTLEIYWNNKFIFTMRMEENLLMNDVPFFLFSNNLTMMDNLSTQKNWLLFLFYAKETTDFCNKFGPNSPILLDWGDQEMQIDVHLPIAGKWRFNDIDRHTRPVPILVPVEGMRHYAPLKKVNESDIPWQDKKNIAIWRGDMSGIVEGKFHWMHENWETKSLEVCMQFPRCRLVYQNQNATLADIGFATCKEPSFQNIDGVNMMRPKLDMKELLKYKMLVSIEGNDVASGLKWNLLSSSVVLMPPAEKSIFSMELLLEPWVHYVPLEVDHVDKAIQWVLEHDDEAQRISQRGTNFMRDLFLHADAERDNAAVLQKIADRISAFWK
jgi:hypothetical protein